MSRTQRTESERRMLRFACSTCGAAVGEWCRITGTKAYTAYAPTLHAPRFYLATAHGLLPLP